MFPDKLIKHFSLHHTVQNQRDGYCKLLPTVFTSNPGA